MKITCNLTSKNGVRKTIRQLEQYRDGLDAKCEKFVSRLAEVGIKTAQMHAGEYGSYIVFRKEISTLPNGCRALLIATDGQKITREWKYQDGTRTAEVSPLIDGRVRKWLACGCEMEEHKRCRSGYFPRTDPRIRPLWLVVGRYRWCEAS